MRRKRLSITLLLKPGAVFRVVVWSTVAVLIIKLIANDQTSQAWLLAASAVFAEVVIFRRLNPKKSLGQIRGLFSDFKEKKAKNRASQQRGDWSWLILLLLFLISLMVRIWNLDYLSPARDEFAHLVAAKRWVTEGHFNYIRGWEVTYLVGLLFKMFSSFSLAIARIVPVVFGSLTTLMIYLLGRRINNSVGMIAAFLWAFSPFAIGLSRYVREYSLYAFLLVLSTWYLLYFMDNIGKLKFGFNSFLKVVLLFLPLLYAFLPEVSLTFRVVFILFACSIAVYLIYYWSGLLARSKSQTLLLRNLGLAFVIVLAVILSIWQYLPLKTGPFDTFFNAQAPVGSWVASQWFLGSFFPSWLLVVLFFIPLILFYQRKDLVIYYSVFLASFALFSFFMGFITQNSFGSRMVFYIQPFYILIYAVLIYIFSRVIIKIWQRFLSFAVLLALFLLIMFNPLTSLGLIANEKNGVADLKQGSPHPDISAVTDILNRSGFRPGDLVITTHNGFFSYYYQYSFVRDSTEWPLIKFKYHHGELRYDYPVNVYLLKEERLAHGLETVVKLINDNNKGWIVIEQSKKSNEELLIKTLMLTDRKIEFLGKVKSKPNFYIYRWRQSLDINESN